MHAEIAGLQQRLGHQPSSAGFGFRASEARRSGQRNSRPPQSPNVGTKPFGTSSTNAIRMMPRMSGALAVILAHQSEPLGWFAPNAVVSH